MTYQLFYLRDPESSHCQRLIKIVEASAANPEISSWGVFPGVLGLATNELYWVVFGDLKDCPTEASEGIEVIDQVTLTPTSRPTTYESRKKDGIYVFRWFEVTEDKVAEVVSLSVEAWKTFEGGFDTEVQGLFTVAPHMDRYGMLLCTWYRDLTVWQESRAPDAAARENFQKRQALLDSAKPIATRLVRHSTSGE